MQKRIILPLLLATGLLCSLNSPVYAGPSDWGSALLELAKNHPAGAVGLGLVVVGGVTHKVLTSKAENTSGNKERKLLATRNTVVPVLLGSGLTLLAGDAAGSYGVPHSGKLLLGAGVGTGFVGYRQVSAVLVKHIRCALLCVPRVLFQSRNVFLPLLILHLFQA